MKITGITKGRVSVEGATETWRVNPGLDINKFVGRDIKALILRKGAVVGVEHNDGSVTGERS